MLDKNKKKAMLSFNTASLVFLKKGASKWFRRNWTKVIIFVCSIFYMWIGYLTMVDSWETLTLIIGLVGFCSGTLLFWWVVLGAIFRVLNLVFTEFVESIVEKKLENIKKKEKNQSKK